MSSNKGLIAYKHAQARNLIVDKELQDSLDRLDAGTSFINEVFQAIDKKRVAKKDKKELDVFVNTLGMDLTYDDELGSYTGGGYKISEHDMSVFKQQKVGHMLTHPKEEWNIKKYLDTDDNMIRPYFQSDDSQEPIVSQNLYEGRNERQEEQAFLAGEVSSDPEFSDKELFHAQNYINKQWRPDDTVSEGAYRSLGGKYAPKGGWSMKSFKHGGKYITDGPETIIVGDNESGKELVEVTPMEGSWQKNTGGGFPSPTPRTWGREPIDDGFIERRTGVASIDDFQDDGFPNLKAFKHGGKYITDGPEQIIVGDNEGGKELVEVTPINESLADKGRGNDTEIRVLDGEKQHVTAFEAYMIDNFGDAAKEAVISNTLKHHGGFPINPNTGLKENQTEGGGFMGMFQEGGFFGGDGPLGGLSDFMAGPGGMVLGGIKMLKGAFDTAGANREKIDELGKSIDTMEDSQADINPELQKQFENLRVEAAGAYDKAVGDIDFAGAADALTSINRGAGSIDTGTATNKIDEFKEQTAENVDAIQSSLKHNLDKGIDVAETQAEDKMNELIESITTAKRQMSQLRKRDQWYENLI